MTISNLISRFAAEKQQTIKDEYNAASRKVDEVVKADVPLRIRRLARVLHLTRQRVKRMEETLNTAGYNLHQGERLTVAYATRTKRNTENEQRRYRRTEEVRRALATAALEIMKTKDGPARVKIIEQFQKTIAGI